MDGEDNLAADTRGRWGGYGEDDLRSACLSAGVEVGNGEQSGAVREASRRGGAWLVLHGSTERRQFGDKAERILSGGWIRIEEKNKINKNFPFFTITYG